MPLAPSSWCSSRPAGPEPRDRRRRNGSVWLASRWPVPVLFVAPPAGFSQIYITSVNPPVQNGSQLLLSWTSDAPAGLWYQVYVNDSLSWYGTGLTASVPLPVHVSRIDIGTVAAANRAVNYGGSLPAAPLREVTLSWLGGTYEAADIAGFHVYGEVAPGGGINYSAILGTVPAYTAGIITDGYGYGGFGEGGFGEASGSYSWTSGVLTNGTWNWGVKSFDTAGNESTAQTAEVTIHAPPLPPAPFSDFTRLHYTYAAGPVFEATLNWQASPG